jgi:acyl carrier protein
MADLTADTVLAGLEAIFEEALREPDIDLNRDSNASNTLNWHPVAHLGIIEMVQRRFKVKFGLTDLEKFKTVGGLVDLVLEKSQPR